MRSCCKFLHKPLHKFTKVLKPESSVLSIHFFQSFVFSKMFNKLLSSSFMPSSLQKKGSIILSGRVKLICIHMQHSFCIFLHSLRKLCVFLLECVFVYIFIEGVTYWVVELWNTASLLFSIICDFTNWSKVDRPMRDPFGKRGDNVQGFSCSLCQ